MRTTCGDEIERIPKPQWDATHDPNFNCFATNLTGSPAQHPFGLISQAWLNNSTISVDMFPAAATNRKASTQNFGGTSPSSSKVRNNVYMGSR